MKLDELKVKRGYSDASVHSAVITNFSDGWSIAFGRPGHWDALEARRGGVRKFKTLDSAVSLANELGYYSVEVINTHVLTRGVE